MAGAGLHAELISEPDELARLAPAWDRLAVANARPLAAPAWILSAWRHMRPDDAELRVVAVREGGELIAIAPFFAQRKGAGRTDLRMLGASLPRIGPLAVPGRERDAAGPIAAALAAARPRADVVAFEGASVGSVWPSALVAGWPGRLRPPSRRYFVQASHFVSLTAGSIDAWLATKGSHFRNRMRRSRRKFAEAGGTARSSTEATLKDDVATFMRLHASRWEGRGTSSIVAQETEWARTCEDVAREHLASGRFRLQLLELDGEPVAARVLAAAGGEVIALNGGWDERYAKLGIAIVGMLHAIDDGCARGDARLDLGPGDQEFKRRLADGNDPVAWTILVVPRPRMGLTLARVAPTVSRIAAREALKRSLPPARQQQLRRLRARLR